MREGLPSEGGKEGIPDKDDSVCSSVWYWLPLYSLYVHWMPPLDGHGGEGVCLHWMDMGGGGMPPLDGHGGGGMPPLDGHGGGGGMAPLDGHGGGCLHWMDMGGGMPPLDGHGGGGGMAPLDGHGGGCLHWMDMGGGDASTGWTWGRRGYAS